MFVSIQEMHIIFHCKKGNTDLGAFYRIPSHQTIDKPPLAKNDFIAILNFNIYIFLNLAFIYEERHTYEI